MQSSSHLTTDSLMTHAESTSSSLLYLLLSMLSVSDSTVSHAASHLGIAQTLTTLLRALPYHAINGRMVVPAEITAKHGVVQEDVFRKGSGARGIDEAVFELATLANDHLNTARSMFKEGGFEGKVPPTVMPVFLAGVCASFVYAILTALISRTHRCLLQTFLVDWRRRISTCLRQVYR